MAKKNTQNDWIKVYLPTEHAFPFWRGYRELFKIRDFILPSKWINENFRLSTSYAVQGSITLFPWQVVPVDAIVYFDTVVYVAPVQTGKSMLGEGIVAYMIETTTNNMMIIYAKKETIEDVFDERLKPLIKEVPAIRKYWSGDDNDLTKKRLKLIHLIARIASAGIKTDIATHNAGFVYGSEIAKWPKKGFSQTKAVEGRKQASRMMGKRVKTLYETSPEHDQDLSYIECHKPGTVIFKPHYECPHCGHWQWLKDSQVKEKPNSRGKKDHNSERIRNDRAAWYECENCKEEITEQERIDISFNVRWMDVKKKIPFEKIIEMKKRPRRAVFNWNRLIDTTWSFAECLASFYDALNSPNPDDLKTYRNEDMAEWVKLKAQRFSDSFIRSKCLKYRQYGADAYVPDGVRVLLLAADTQDNGFYYIARGYGANLESWLVRSDFIFCDMKDVTNPADVLEIVNKEIYRYPFAKKDMSELPILFGLWDRGGHRSTDVDYIVSHSHNLGAYIGSTARTAPLIEQKASGHYFGHTERLSRIVQKNMESKIWHLPVDISKDYCGQVLNQYDEEIIDSRGNVKKRRVCKDPDHYRDIENYLAGLVILLDLQSQLFNDTPDIEGFENKIAENAVMREKEEESENGLVTKTDNILGDFKGEMSAWGW